MGLNIIAAIKDLTNLELIIAGWYSDEDNEFLDEILLVPNMKYRGLLQPKDVLALEASADVMIALYKPELLRYNIMLPNKLFEAMMCGIPLVTNIVPNIAEEADCGIIVSYDDVDEIRQAIITLRDNPALRQKLSLNGRNSFLEKYNWSKMDVELFNIYEILLQQ